MPGLRADPTRGSGRASMVLPSGSTSVCWSSRWGLAPAASEAPDDPLAGL